MRRSSSCLLALVLLLAAACTSGPATPPGGVDAGAAAGEPDAGAAASCAGATPFMGACSSADDCATCLCFTYGMGEMRCTKECSTDADCPAPSTGCSGMGVCKRPNG